MKSNLINEKMSMWSQANCLCTLCFGGRKRSKNQITVPLIFNDAANMNVWLKYLVFWQN